MGKKPKIIVTVQGSKVQGFTENPPASQAWRTGR